MRRFEFSEGTSNKFWQISREGAALTISFGKIGSKGQSQLKEFASDAAAVAERDKLIAEKTKKGYAEVDADGAPAAAPAKPKAEKAEASPAPVVAAIPKEIGRAHV